MLKPMLTIAGLMLILFASPAARAQVVLDVSKITCEQLINWSITDPRNIAFWLSGYYNGKRNNTVLETQSFKDNVDKVTDYCRGNRTVTAMQAVETVLNPAR